MLKLSSINGLISKFLKDGQISPEEFHVILAEIDSYRDHKSQIRKKIRTVIKEMSAEKEEQIREEAEKRSAEGQRIYDERPPEYSATSPGYGLNFNLICCSYNG